jgi:signal transduction histidine kinase
MNIASTIIFSLSAFVCLFLSILVFSRNSKEKLNIFFSLYLFSLFLWTICFYLTFIIDTGWLATLMLRFSIAFAISAVSLALNFILYFPKWIEIIPRKFIRLLWLETFILFLITVFTPYIGYSETAEGTVYGSFYALFVIHFVVVGAISIGVGVYKYFKATGIDKLQLRFFFLGIVITIPLGVVNNIILPVVFENYPFEVYGVMVPMFISLPISYTILKHRFLNIRIVIGSILYFFLLSIIPYSLFYFVSYYETLFFGSVFTNQSFLLGMIQAPIFTIILLAASKFIKQTLNDTFVYISYNPIEWRNFFIKNTSSELRLNRLIQIFKKTLYGSLRPNTVNVFILGHDGHTLLKDADSKTEIILNYELLSLIYKITRRQVITLNELQSETELQENPYVKGMVKMMTEMRMEVLLFTQQKNSFFAIVGLGDKRDQSAYDLEDLNYLDSLITNLSVGIERSLLYLEKLDSEKNLKERVKSATKTLRTQKKELQDKYQFEKDMMGILGHELRTPMTVAKGMAELVMAKNKNQQIDPAYLEDKMHKIYDSIIKESDLIQTMLSTSHVDNDKLNLQIMPVNLLEVIEYSFSAFQQDAKNKQLELIYEKPSFSVPLINSDPNRVQEIINNLVSNAVKYTHQGHVRIFLVQENEFIVVNIEDTGIGIPRNEIENLGKKFYRLHQHLDKYKDVVRAGGTGLGLYVVKGVLRALGGELRVKSESGNGSTFSAVFPIQAKVDPSMVVVRNSDDQHDMFHQLGLKSKP